MDSFRTAREQTTGGTPRIHWVVRIQHRVRIAAYAATYAGFAAQMWGKGYGDVAWGLLLLQCAAYPHAVFLLSRRAANQLETELNFLLLDALLVGAWVGLTGFPLWLAFTMYIGTTLACTFSRGWWGAAAASALFAAGALATALAAGHGLRLVETEGIAVVVCVVMLALYLLMIGNISFYRNRKLREARQRLQASETALLEANEVLRRQLEEIDALHAKLSEQANRDPLTGLYNRRYLDATLDRELARCKREGRPLSLMMIDVDHFKRINDTYGHLGGDEMLKEIGTLLATHARAGDVACRYGGEEFTLLLPHMPLEAARERAEMLRSTFATSSVRFGEFAIRTTISIGIAVYPEHGKLPDELTRMADHALYRAKEEGRDRVIVFDRGSMATA